MRRESCPICGNELRPEHAHDKCDVCGYLTHCCAGECAQPDTSGDFMEISKVEFHKAYKFSVDLLTYRKEIGYVMIKNLPMSEVYSDKEDLILERSPDINGFFNAEEFAPNICKLRITVDPSHSNPIVFEVSWEGIMREPLRLNAASTNFFTERLRLTGVKYIITSSHYCPMCHGDCIVAKHKQMTRNG